MDDNSLKTLRILHNEENYDIFMALVKDITPNNIANILKHKKDILLLMDYLLVRESLKGREIEDKEYKDFRIDLYSLFTEIEKAVKIQKPK